MQTSNLPAQNSNRTSTAGLHFIQPTNIVTIYLDHWPCSNVGRVTKRAYWIARNFPPFLQEDSEKCTLASCTGEFGNSPVLWRAPSLHYKNNWIWKENIREHKAIWLNKNYSNKCVIILHFLPNKCQHNICNQFAITSSHFSVIHNYYCSTECLHSVVTVYLTLSCY